MQYLSLLNLLQRREPGDSALQAAEPLGNFVDDSL
ncbi:hypothetical protein STVIR_5372 [Streptomyces viridochromogenes Tue57]|uniref:Uncharacterized protein n=1 Tax=Streptomyces viridochromogenes Tue57 TaxID=1160705 RepID=L8P7P1_STRVR|nr:hypothetical protein STVIR_5372 [Streptomyces viridochromogenes Tue57]